VGNRLGTIRIPRPLALTSRLWAMIHSLTSWLLCQLALSQMRSSAFLPFCWSLWQRLVLETHSPLWMALGEPDQPVSSPFLREYCGSGLSIQRLARSHRTPRRSKVARMVSPLSSLSVIPSSKLTSAAIRRVHKLLSLPYFLGSWWSISRKVWAPLSSKAAWTSLWDARSQPVERPGLGG
jgi:hypothetical protein